MTSLRSEVGIPTTPASTTTASPIVPAQRLAEAALGGRSMEGHESRKWMGERLVLGDGMGGSAGPPAIDREPTVQPRSQTITGQRIVQGCRRQRRQRRAKPLAGHRSCNWGFPNGRSKLGTEQHGNWGFHNGRFKLGTQQLGRRHRRKRDDPLDAMLALQGALGKGRRVCLRQRVGLAERLVIDMLQVLAVLGRQFKENSPGFQNGEQAELAVAEQQSEADHAGEAFQ